LCRLDAEILKCKQQMAKTKGPARESAKRRALQLLKQKKVYEKHRDGMFSQQFNIDQTKFAQASLKDTATTVSAMKGAHKELKTAFKDMDMDDLEDLQDDMADMMEMHDEVNEIMGRSYAVPDEIDDDMLEAELDELGDELADETEIPSYLLNAATAKKTANMQPATTTTSASSEIVKDEFGLPVSKVTL